MFGFIFTLLGGSIFHIGHGVPLLPIQVLWVSFVTVTIQSIGLGYSSADDGLMDRRPRSPNESLLNRGQMIWLATAGLLMAIGTLLLTSGAEHTHALAFARTMGMITLSMFCLFFSFEAKDEQESAFSLDTFYDRTFRLTTAASLSLIVISTLLKPLKITHLSFAQFLICAGVALLIFLITEIQKEARRRMAVKATQPGQQ